MTAVTQVISAQNTGSSLTLSLTGISCLKGTLLVLGYGTGVTGTTNAVSLVSDTRGLNFSGGVASSGSGAWVNTSVGGAAANTAVTPNVVSTLTILSIITTRDLVNETLTLTFNQPGGAAGTVVDVAAALFIIGGGKTALENFAQTTHATSSGSSANVSTVGGSQIGTAKVGEYILVLAGYDPAGATQMAVPSGYTTGLQSASGHKSSVFIGYKDYTSLPGGAPSASVATTYFTWNGGIAGFAAAQVFTSTTLQSKSVLSRISMSATGHIGALDSGTIATALTKMSMVAHGSQTIKGSMTTVLRGVAQSALAFEAAVYGPVTTHLPGKVAQALTGDTHNGGVITMHLPRPTQVAHGQHIITGPIVTHLDNSIGLAIQAHAFEEFFASIRTDLSFAHVAQQLEGEVFLDAKITTHLGLGAFRISTNVKASQIILGPIVTTLYGLHVPAVGGLMGAPGDGKWYSWRNTDS